MAHQGVFVLVFTLLVMGALAVDLSSQHRVRVVRMDPKHHHEAEHHEHHEEQSDEQGKEHEHTHSHKMKGILEDQEDRMETIKRKPLPYFQSEYLACSDDSDCCPKSRCEWPAKAVRGTTDHKTCILLHSGGKGSPEVYCEPCTPISARYRNGVCDPATAKFYDKPAKLKGKKHHHHKSEDSSSESATGTGAPLQGSDFNGEDEKPKRVKHHHIIHLPEVDVPGEAPHTTLTSDEVDDLARDTILKARRTKCNAEDEWCKEMLDYQAPDIDPETELDREVKAKLLRQEMLELRQFFKDMKKHGVGPKEVH